MQKYIPSLHFIAILTLCITACSSYQIRTGNVDSLSGLQAMSSCTKCGLGGKAKTSKIREMALKETALSISAQAALASRAKLIDEDLTRQARYLDSVFNFNSLVLEHNILPPVLVEGRNTLNLADAQTIRISDRTYKVSKQARFITTPPNWRHYLWMDYKVPDYPNVSLLPKTKQERKLWAFYVARGWRNGIEQANVILEESVARIKEDFTGMVLYRKLLAMNMVSPPFVSHTDLGVTGDETEIHIDDRVLRITALPALNVNSDEWRAAVEKDEQSLEQFVNMEQLVQNAKVNITSNAWQPNIAPVN